MGDDEEEEEEKKDGEETIACLDDDDDDNDGLSGFPREKHTSLGGSVYDCVEYTRIN